MKHLIKDLKWDWSYGDGGKTNAVCRAKSPSHEYIIRLEAGGDCYVDYRRFDNDEDADNRKDEPPVFGSIKAAQDWVEEVHYPSKMAKWLNTDWSKKAVTPYVREVFAEWAKTDPLTDTVNWFKKAKPEPTNKDICVQIGCHYEEVAEMMVACHGVPHMGSKVMNNCAEAYKETTEAYGLDEAMQPKDNIELLDALCDQIVTATGVAYMMGFDIIGALKEVNASNWSKFVDGKAVTDENGKIIKGSGYFKPELGKFVGGGDD